MAPRQAYGLMFLKLRSHSNSDFMLQILPLMAKEPRRERELIPPTIIVRKYFSFSRALTLKNTGLKLDLCTDAASE